jgi:hypothetical protein
MVKISKVITLSVAAALGLSVAAYAAKAADATLPVVVKAARGLSLEVGTKKVAGYYMAKSGVCDVTLMVADLPDADGYVTAQLSRMNVPVKAGTNARVYTSEGKALELSCSLTTSLMTVRTLEQVALAVK